MDSRRQFFISPARSKSDIKDAKELFTAYVTWLDVDLKFQDFSQEMSSLPGQYSPPLGDILIARDDQGHALGCVALRPLKSETTVQRFCEMKRLYVTPQGRNLGIGQQLVQQIIFLGARLDYSEMRLDTLGHMYSALKLYEKFGFTFIDPYYHNPLSNVKFLAKKLR